MDYWIGVCTTVSLIISILLFFGVKGVKEKTKQIEDRFEQMPTKRFLAEHVLDASKERYKFGPGDIVIRDGEQYTVIGGVNEQGIVECESDKDQIKDQIKKFKWYELRKFEPSSPPDID